MPDPEGIGRAIREPLLKIFPPALLGRLVTIPYYPLNDEMITAISQIQLRKIARRVEEPETYALDAEQVGRFLRDHPQRRKRR